MTQRKTLDLIRDDLYVIASEMNREAGRLIGIADVVSIVNEDEVLAGNLVRSADRITQIANRLVKIV